MSASMPSIALHDLAVEFSYIDSGAPPGEGDYPTFILFHGHTFYRDVWRPMFDLAPAHRARLIAVDRRGYGASTPYTPEEQELISQGPDEARLAFMEREAEALLKFVDAAIARCALPPRVVLVAWSAAVAYAYPLLDALPRLTPASQERVRSSVIGVVFFDPPVSAWGLSGPSLYLPITDENIPPGKTRFDAFNRWFSIYWHHRSTDSHDPTTLCATEEENDAQANSSCYARRVATLDTMTRAQRDALSNLDAANLCDSFVVSPPHFGNVLAELRERTLFNEECMSHWVGARLSYLWCDCTTWSIVMGKWKLEEEIQARQGRSYAPPVEFRRMDGCNHFAAWDDPEKTMMALVELAERK
ncbi:alpha/beta-hydrolase [Schizophyllum commune H4-8]|uniref:alpha/beta-hydrolase n=1 Tax=Schizophyllum commune (strain H4-8 / FGSC 9210) TaxID=578458 RepID=UPI00215E01AE|nr:alpha/beta-hydrolase [Schizophyllum commune H4-8]KAI5896630.1 alpha/beta-hydrolase [Schizophyllum commune H4-8]